MKTPAFWYQPATGSGRLLIAWVLVPLAWVYRLGGFIHRQIHRPLRPALPVICIGNLTSGGTGKTPLVAALAAQAVARGMEPVVLMRGYGGRLRGPHVVALKEDDAASVGDEAMLLASQTVAAKQKQALPVVIAAMRAAGAHFIETHQLGNLIIMDDGLQNPTISAHRRVAVFDGSRGIGNGMVIPAGPLRQPLRAALPGLDAAVIHGTDCHDLEALLQQSAPGMPVFTMNSRLEDTSAAAIRNRRIIGFAGIGSPQRFRRSLEIAGAEIADFHAFADHHPFSTAELEALRSQAREKSALLVTTAKDAMRLPIAERETVTIVRQVLELPPELVAFLLAPMEPCK